MSVHVGGKYKLCTGVHGMDEAIGQCMHVCLLVCALVTKFLSSALSSLAF